MLACGAAEEASVIVPLTGVTLNQFPPFWVVALALQFTLLTELVEMVTDCAGIGEPTVPCSAGSADSETMVCGGAVTFTVTGTVRDDGLACGSVMVMVPP